MSAGTAGQSLFRGTHVTRTDPPAPGLLAAAVDLGARLRVFDHDGALAGASREVWAIIEPDIHAISTAYWEQWLRCFADDRVWAQHEVARVAA
jgi:methyl-accepting chemotaxis protein